MNSDVTIQAHLKIELSSEEKKHLKGVGVEEGFLKQMISAEEFQETYDLVSQEYRDREYTETNIPKYLVRGLKVVEAIKDEIERVERNYELSDHEIAIYFRVVRKKPKKKRRK